MSGYVLYFGNILEWTQFFIFDQTINPLHFLRKLSETCHRLFFNNVALCTMRGKFCPVNPSVSLQKNVKNVSRKFWIQIYNPDSIYIN